MRLSLNTLASRAHRWSRGALAVLHRLESAYVPQVAPAPFFPRLGRVRLGSATASQATERTCGTTVLALANALFDPALLAHLQAADAVDLPARDRAQLTRTRFRQLQEDLLGAVTHRTWTPALGTPPWGLARQLRVPGVRYTHLPVSDRDPALMEALLALLRRASGAGVPVPLYVGGDTSSGIASAVPRHVVLLVPPAAIAPPLQSTDHARIYEPASGRMFRRRWSDLSARTSADKALGGWTHLAWAVLPDDRR